jgi:hypothetical protein
MDRFFTLAEAEAEVDFGIRFLRAFHIFDWADRIDLERFDCRGSTTCVLGQIFKNCGGFYLGFNAFERWRDRGIPLRNSSGGFARPPATNETDAWELVNDVWLKRIKAGKGLAA